MPSFAVWLRQSRQPLRALSEWDEDGAGAARCGARPRSAVRAASLGRHTEGVGLRALLPLARASLIEFPADDPERARRFWSGVLGLELEPRRDGEGEGWQTHTGAPAVGVHVRGRGPGDFVFAAVFCGGRSGRRARACER
jgi:hypothetical protein